MDEDLCNPNKILDLQLLHSYQEKLKNEVFIDKLSTFNRKYQKQLIETL